MAQLIDIQRVEIGPQNLTARVRVADDAPLMTSEDLQGTTRVYRLMPHIIEHTCLGDAGDTFKACMGNTELAHLLEHVTVELLAQTDMAGDITSGRTYPIEGDDRAFDVEISCKDDVLTVAALSSAAWILDWAYSGGGDPVPDVDAIVSGLKNLVASLGDEPATDYVQKVRGELQEDVKREYQEALEAREREIAEREEEIDQARRKAEETARARAEELERQRQEEQRRREEEERQRAEAEARAKEETARIEAERLAKEAAKRKAEEDRLFEEVAREAERRTTVMMPDEGKESPEAVQASRDLPDTAVSEWRPEEPEPKAAQSAEAAPVAQAAPAPAPAASQEPGAEPVAAPAKAEQGEKDAPVAEAAGEAEPAQPQEPAEEADAEAEPAPASEQEPQAGAQPAPAAQPEYVAPWEDEPSEADAPLAQAKDASEADGGPEAPQTDGDGSSQSDGHIPEPQRVR